MRAAGGLILGSNSDQRPLNLNRHCRIWAYWSRKSTGAM